MGPTGRIEHAEEPAKSPEARDALRLAALSQESARGRLRRRSPDEAVKEWKGLVAARWTLREQFDHDGKRYLVAERNDSPVNWIDELSDREQQVVAFASLGHWNKLIAYDLGIADSTVRVLLTRAAAKAGVHTRRELVELFLRDRLRTDKPRKSWTQSLCLEARPLFAYVSKRKHIRRCCSGSPCWKVGP